MIDNKLLGRSCATLLQRSSVSRWVEVKKHDGMAASAGWPSRFSCFFHRFPISVKGFVGRIVGHLLAWDKIIAQLAL